MAKRTKEEAAELVLRAMIADMRRQGWTISDAEADEKVRRMKAALLSKDS